MRRTMFPRFRPEFYPANLALLDEARACAAESGCSLAQLALAWTLAKGAHVIPIPGTTRTGHLDDNIAAGQVYLTPDIVARLDAHFAPERPAGPRYTSRAQDTVDTEQFDFELDADS